MSQSEISHDEAQFGLDSVHHQRSDEEQACWVAAALGFLLGILLVVCDFVNYRNKGYLTNPLLQIALICFTSVMFFTIAYFAGKHLRTRRERQEQVPQFPRVAAKTKKNL